MSQLEDMLLGQIRMVGLPEPQREYAFAKPRRWRFDLAWVTRLIAVEVEGGVWVGGRHQTGQGFTRDCEKLSEAAVLGWRVIRVTGDMVQKGEALRLIERALRDSTMSSEAP